MKFFSFIFFLLLGAHSSFAQEDLATLKQDTPIVKDWLITMGIFAAPISFTKVNNEKDINYGTEFAADKGNQEVRFFYERGSYSSTDPVNFITVRSSQHAAFLSYDYNNAFSNVTLFALSSFERNSNGGVQTVSAEIRAGILGLKFQKKFKKGIFKSLSLSYIPLYEYIDQLRETPESTLVDPIFVDTYARNIRHSFRLKVKTSFIDDQIEVKNTFFYRPAMNLTDYKVDFNNADLENVFNFEYFFNEQISFSFRNIYTWDTRRKFISKIPSVDIENRFNFSYGFTF